MRKNELHMYMLIAGQQGTNFSHSPQQSCHVSPLRVCIDSSQVSCPLNPNGSRPHGIPSGLKQLEFVSSMIRSIKSNSPQWEDPCKNQGVQYILHQSRAYAIALVATVRVNLETYVLLACLLPLETKWSFTEFK